jgi:hypothetical protein
VHVSTVQSEMAGPISVPVKVRVVVTTVPGFAATLVVFWKLVVVKVVTPLVLVELILSSMTSVLGSLTVDGAYKAGTRRRLVV